MPILGLNIANLQAERDIARLIQSLKCKDIRTRFAALVTLGAACALPDLEALLRSDQRGLARDAKQCVIAIRQRWNLPTISGF